MKDCLGGTRFEKWEIRARKGIGRGEGVVLEGEVGDNRWIQGATWNRPDELKILVACRGWSRGHVKTRSKKVTAENTLALAA